MTNLLSNQNLSIHLLKKKYFPTRVQKANESINSLPKFIFYYYIFYTAIFMKFVCFHFYSLMSPLDAKSHSNLLGSYFTTKE